MISLSLIPGHMNTGVAFGQTLLENFVLVLGQRLQYLPLTTFNLLHLLLYKIPACQAFLLNV